MESEWHWQQCPLVMLCDGHIVVRAVVLRLGPHPNWYRTYAYIPTPSLRNPKFHPLNLVYSRHKSDHIYRQPSSRRTDTIFPFTVKTIFTFAHKTVQTSGKHRIPIAPFRLFSIHTRVCTFIDRHSWAGGASSSSSSIHFDIRRQYWLATTTYFGIVEITYHLFLRGNEDTATSKGVVKRERGAPDPARHRFHMRMGAHKCSSVY